MKNTFMEGSKHNEEKPVNGKLAFQIATENYLNRINTTSLKFEINILIQYTIVFEDTQTN